MTVASCVPPAAHSEGLECLAAPTGASDGFGYSLAATGRTLLVGDPQANTVWVYEDGENGFKQTRALQPPAGSDAADYGKGFGHAVDMDASGALIIGAFAEDAMGVAPRKNSGDGFRRLSEIFVASDTSRPVTEVPRLYELMETEAFGFSVTRTDDHIALGVRAIAGERYGLSSVLVINLADGNHTRIDAPTPDAGVDFGFALASGGDTLVIGAPWLPPSGGALIYDLAANERSIVTTLKDTPRTGFSVAMDGKRVALGGEATVVVDRNGGDWAVSTILASVNGTVAVGDGRVATLREATRNRGIGERPTTPPMDLTLTVDGVTTTNRLAEPGRLGRGNWPHRSIAATDDFVLLGRPSEVRGCKVTILDLKLPN